MAQASAPTLLADVVATPTLSPACRADMFELMRASFDGVERATFERDLAEKPWTILLRERRRGCVCGFSTLCLLHSDVAGMPVSAIYSGDTIIARPYWGALSLERAWFRFAFGQRAARPDRRWFWFLACKGYRTYRYLPVYFRAYYPHPEVSPPPFMLALRDTLGRARFGADYDAVTGVIHRPHDYRLKPGLSDIGAREMGDPRIAAFQRLNPGWREGAELACLVALEQENLRRCGLRMLAGGIAS